MSKENNYIKYNSIISIGILSEEYENSHFSKFLYAEENLEHSLNFKLCKKSFLDYSDIKGSLFYIRNIEECITNFGFAEKQENISKDFGYLSKEKLHKNSNFYLQHMTSKKFISIERTLDNKYNLKLIKNIDKAANFYLRKVNDNRRNSREYMNINDIFNISIYIKEDDIFYYLKDDIISLKEDNKKYKIIIDNNPITNFFILDQQWFIKETKEIYSGQLINIIFSNIKEKYRYMLSVKELSKEDIEKDKYNNIIDSSDQDEEENTNKKYNIIGIPYTDELNIQVSNNSFWILEEDDTCSDYMIKSPLKINEAYRIRNLNTGLYLKIKKRKTNIDTSLSINEEISNKLYDFILVDEKILNKKFIFGYNFILYHSSFGILKPELVDNGEYIIKGVYKDLNLKDINKYKSYYKPISLNIYKSNNNKYTNNKKFNDDKYNIAIKQGEDFVFSIKKVDLYQGIQVNYINKIISILDNALKEKDIENKNIINKSIKFLFEYLMNIDYSFRDEKYEYNIPIEGRQILLLNFHIVELIDKSLEYYLYKFGKEKYDLSNENIKRTINELLNSVIKFYENLSVSNEKIKESIYIISLNKLLKLSDIIFYGDKTNIASLINCIFNLIDNSEPLQDYFLGGGNLLKSSIDKNLEYYNLDNLLREHKLLEYIEKSHNYLLYYEKLMGLNKVQYKKEEIELHIKQNIASVKRKSRANMETYETIFHDIIVNIKKLIRKHAILLDILIKQKEQENTPKKTQKKRRTFKSIFSKYKKEENKNEKLKRADKKKVTTKISSNIVLSETERAETTNKLIESEEDNKSETGIYNNNKIIKEEENENEDKNKKKDIYDRKENISFKKRFTINNLFKNKTNSEIINNYDKYGENSELRRIKAEFNNIDDSKKITPKKGISQFFKGLVGYKSAKINKVKTAFSSKFDEKTTTIKHENSSYYINYLYKLGLISEFIKFFTSLNLNKALFIDDEFDKISEKENNRGGIIDNSLYIFFSRNSNNLKKNKFLDNNYINVLLFYLYNMLFPNIKENLKEKIKNNNFKGNDIILELNLNNIDNENYSEEYVEDETKYGKEMIEDFKTIDDDLCILYSAFQFSINQYTKTVYKLFNLNFNFFLNYLSENDLIKSKSYFSRIINELLNRIVFLNKESFENVFNKYKSNPSLLNPEITLKNLYLQNNNNKNSKNKKNKNESFSTNEAMLIENMFYFLKKCDEIKYLYEKIVIYKYIKNCIQNKKALNELEKEKNDEKNEEEINNKKDLSNILEQLNQQKLKILSLYEDLINTSKKYLLINKGQKEENINDVDINIKEDEKDKFIIKKIKDRLEFITQLLKNYEIKKLFNNMIYIELTDENIENDKALKKLKRLREYFEIIDNQILNIRLNYEKNEENKEYLNEQALKEINGILGKLCNDKNPEFLVFNNNKKNENNELVKMLIQENKSFYKKIKFTKLFAKMIKNISYFDKNDNNDVLIYCSYLLIIFNDLKNKYSDFHKNITKYYRLYGYLIFKSLNCINDCKKEKIDDESLFLKICYLGIESIITMIKNGKLDFKQMRNFLETVFSELRKVFYQFINKKYKIIFQILYTYAVSRILLFLNKQKTKDSSINYIFFNIIYPINEMRNNIVFCFETINNSLDKEHILSRRNSEIFMDNDTMINSEESEDSLSKYIQEEEKEGLIINDFGDKIIPMDLSIINKPTKKNSSKKKKSEKINIKIENNKKKNEKMDEDYIRWDNENEINRLSFYLNYLSVYVIYLNDKNSLMKENKDEFPKKEKEEKSNFSFNVLSDKIKILLDTEHNYDNNLKQNENIIDNNNNLIISQLNNFIIEEEKNFLGENLEPKNIDYKFFSVLLESILFYRNNLNGQNIEIQIRKIKNKKENKEKYTDNENETDTLIKKEELYIDRKDNDKIVFYYYSPEYIDIILLEKILREIDLTDDLADYCLEDSHTEKINSNLLEELFKDKIAFRIIQSYYDEEYQLIHNYFINNNMELLIKKILKSFNSNDFNKISEMENYFYKRMGEIYSNTKISNDLIQKNNSLVDYLIRKENNKKRKEDNNKDESELKESNKNIDMERVNTIIDPNITNEQKSKIISKEIDIISFFDSLVYIYQKFGKSTSIIYYKRGFELLMDKSILEYDKETSGKKNYIKFESESMLNTLILLFSSKSNKKILEDKKVFPIIISGIKFFLLYILSKEDDFIFKNIELMKELFIKLDFVFDILSKDFEKIVYFMKKPNKTKDINKFIKKKKKLKNILDFLIILLEFKKINEHILTKEIIEFNEKVVENVIKLLFILLELPDNLNFQAIDILIEFLFNFIEGPNIKNLNLLFTSGYFDLLSYVIKDIDYYNIFLNYLNKDNLYEVINYYAIAECKIIKIFIIYYNITHSTNNIEDFEILQQRYEDNFDLIKKKLKRLYYISKKEMENREYNIDKMLLFIKKNDDYEGIKERLNGENNSDKNNKNKNQQKMIKKLMKKEENELNENKNLSKDSINQYCIVKFDLLLLYYSLFNYHIDLSTKTEINISNKNIFSLFFSFISKIFILIFRIITIVFYAIYFIFIKTSVKKKTDVDLLQDLKNIEYESQLIDEQDIINFLKKYIKELEISLDNIIYKIYFPMLNKANTIKIYEYEYYKVEQIDSSDFINYLIDNYDSIHIRAKQYVSINKIINLPILNVFFKNINILGQILIIFSLISNLIIMLSYNDYITICDEENDIKLRKNKNYVRLECPYLLYNKKYESSIVLNLLKIFGIIELILQSIIFIDYIVRIFLVEQAKAKLKRENNNIFNMIFIFLETIFNSIINFRSFYYILSIIFICLGLSIHPFFYCITLLEFVNRIQLMQAVLKAMYKPLANILITLLMFIILEYLFSLFAISYFTYHFPNITDTKNFLKTFMRTIEQTFKQDGGVGTYLNKRLDPDYTPYTVSAYFNIKIFYDLLFFLLILSLIFQLFLSTIIDHFNETRENDENFQEGLETNCTVCGMEREKIEKIHSNNKNAFEKHITYFHNAFNYIYYLMYLQSLSFRDVVVEEEVWRLLIEKDLSFLPKNSCFKIFEKKCWKKLDAKKKHDNGEEEE